MKISLKIKETAKFSTETESLGIEGRRNEALKIEADRQIREISLLNELKLRELNQRLEMDIPQIGEDTDTFTLNIEPEKFMDNP